MKKLGQEFDVLLIIQDNTIKPVYSISQNNYFKGDEGFQHKIKRKYSELPECDFVMLLLRKDYNIEKYEFSYNIEKKNQSIKKNLIE